MLKLHRNRRAQVFSRLVESLEQRQLLASVMVDVRQLGAAAGSGKSITVAENGTFTLGVYLKNINSASGVSADANNGLGSFTFGLKTTNEKYKSGLAWPVSPTATDTVVNATASKNMMSTSTFDIGYSDGIAHDIGASPAAFGFPSDTDTDIDMSGLGGTQFDTGSPSYVTGLGVNSEVLLGTVTFKAIDLNDATRGFNRSTQINAYYTNELGSFGGLVVRGLINNKTDNTNQVSTANLITSASQIGGAVNVTVSGTNPTFTGGISGSVFNDVNGNGVKDGTETGKSAVSVFLDTNKNGALDAGEASTATDGSGNYKFASLAAGSYRVRVVPPASSTVTAPAVGYFDVSVATSVISGKNFGIKTSAVGVGSISGKIFSDNNKNGTFDAGDTVLGNRKIFIDANKNGKLDSGEKTATSNGSGVYTFSGLAAGNYRLRRADLPTNYVNTVPSIGYYDVTLASGATITGKDFGAALKTVATGASISGKIFSDNNKNGKFDTGDTVLSNRKIFIDANKNGKLDSGEKTATSNGSGIYTFSGLAAGTYRLRRADTPTNYVITDPASGFYDITVTASQTVTGKDFGAAPK